MKFRKAQMAGLGGIGAIGLALVVVSILLSVGQTILTSILSTQNADAYDYNTTLQGQLGLWNIAQWLGTMGLIAGAVAVIGMVITAFKPRGGTIGEL